MAAGYYIAAPRISWPINASLEARDPPTGPMPSQHVTARPDDGVREGRGLDERGSIPHAAIAVFARAGRRRARLRHMPEDDAGQRVYRLAFAEPIVEIFLDGCAQGGGTC